MVYRPRINTYNVLEIVVKYTLDEEVKVKFSLYLISNSVLLIKKTQKL